MSKKSAARLTEAEMYLMYGNCRVKFISYYKYTFFYKGFTPDGLELLCQYGGDAEEIYKERVHADEELSIKAVCPNVVKIYDGKTLIEFYADNGSTVYVN